MKDFPADTRQTRIVLPDPVGTLWLTASGDALTGLWFQDQLHFPVQVPALPADPAHPVFRDTLAWLTAYLSSAALPAMPSLRPAGSAFQLAVWSQLRSIPFGSAVTYGRLADILTAQGVPACAQAVGGAVGRNPIALLIPCHRVVGRGGRLTGYAGGLARKRFLLKLEAETIRHLRG